MQTTLLVVAKAPVPGEAKTRMCPPATPEQAAGIAAAALLDTLDAAPAEHTMVALAGRLARAARAAALQSAMRERRVVAQRGDGFAERLAAAHADAAVRGCPALQVGMDTPQLSAEIVGAASRQLARSDAVLGPATDGGWWALGLHDHRHAEALREVPMSTPDTGELTLRALRRRGLRVALLPEMADVDTVADAVRVAGQLPGSRFAAAMASLAGAFETGPAPRPAGRPA